MNVNEIYDFVICVFRTIASLPASCGDGGFFFGSTKIFEFVRGVADATRVRGQTTTLWYLPYNFVIRYRRYPLRGNYGHSLEGPANYL